MTAKKRIWERELSSVDESTHVSPHITKTRTELEILLLSLIVFPPMLLLSCWLCVSSVFSNLRETFAIFHFSFFLSLSISPFPFFLWIETIWTYAIFLPIFSTICKCIVEIEKKMCCVFVQKKIVFWWS